MRRAWLLVVPVVAVVTLAAACSDSGAPSRTATLRAMADATIVPGYVELDAAARSMVDASAAVCRSATPESVAAARAAMAHLRATWKTLEPVWIGPVMMRRSWSTIDWPVDGDEIDDLIADESVTNLDAAYLADRAGADQRGLGAIEYLLSAGDSPGDGGDDAAVAALADPRRCGYLEGAARVIATEASLLVEDWTRAYRGGASYRDKLGDSANTGDLDSLVNDVIFLFEKMTGAELGRALGLTGDADPTAIVEGPATLGTADAAARLAGLRDALVGAPGHGDGLAPLLGSDLTERLRAQFAAADAAIAPLPSSLRAAVVTDPDAVARLRDAVMALQVTVSTEVVSKLGVVLGFADADGDSG